MTEREQLNQLRQINDICLFVKDFDQTVKFYTEVFGMKCLSIRRGPTHGSYAEFSFCGTELTLWSRDGIEEILGKDFFCGNGGCFMIAIRLAEQKDVDALSALLLSRGAVCLKKPETYPFGFRACYFADCENNVWEIFS